MNKNHVIIRHNFSKPFARCLQCGKHYICGIILIILSIQEHINLAISIFKVKSVASALLSQGIA